MWSSVCPGITKIIYFMKVSDLGNTLAPVLNFFGKVWNISYFVKNKSQWEYVVAYCRSILCILRVSKCILGVCLVFIESMSGGITEIHR